MQKEDVLPKGGQLWSMPLTLHELNAADPILDLMDPQMTLLDPYEHILTGHWLVEHI